MSQLKSKRLIAADEASLIMGRNNILCHLYSAAMCCGSPDGNRGKFIYYLSLKYNKDVAELLADGEFDCRNDDSKIFVFLQQYSVMLNRLLNID